MHRSDAAIIRVITPMADGESADAAQERVMKLARHFLPLLDRSIPQ
jgi:hypothetical protein